MAKTYKIPRVTYVEVAQKNEDGLYPVVLKFTSQTSDGKLHWQAQSITDFLPDTPTAIGNYAQNFVDDLESHGYELQS